MRRSGKYAYVDGISCVTGWTLNKRSTVTRYAASCVPDGTATAKGNVDWTGSITGIGYLPPMPIEDDIPFVGVASAKAGEVVNYEGNILISEVTIAIPVNAGTPITWSANFGVQGDLEKTSSPAYFDDTREPGPSGTDGKIQIRLDPDTGAYVPVADVQGITLVFRRPPVTTVDAGFMYREAGNLEADLNFQVSNDDLEEAAYAVNEVRAVRVFVTPTLFYEYDAIQFSDHSNYQVVRNPPAIIGFQVNGMWTGLRERTPAALGKILLPGGAELYGEP